MKKYMLFINVFVILSAAFPLGSNAQKFQPNKINIHDFKVEESKDGKNFKTITYIPGADPAKTGCDCYVYFDKINTNKKESYYRLMHVDTNGEVEFNEIEFPL